MPSLATAPGAVTTELTHVVYTRNANGTATIYLDGQPVAVKTIEGTLDELNRASPQFVNQLKAQNQFNSMLRTGSVPGTPLTTQTL